MLTILCTSKPADGLFYYSYEYAAALYDAGVDVRLVVVCHPTFSYVHYSTALEEKYLNHPVPVQFDLCNTKVSDATFILGRSMLTLAYQNFKAYSQFTQGVLRDLFASKVIATYSENHPLDYPKAVAFFTPTSIVDLCDYDVYPNGVGEHFEKRVNFDIHKDLDLTPPKQFTYLLLGTNAEYYAAAEAYLDLRPELHTKHAILTYLGAQWNNLDRTHLYAPAKNLLNAFSTYVYTKPTFDPAPRLIQECKHAGRGLIWARPDLKDGGLAYWRRGLKAPDLTQILKAL